MMTTLRPDRRALLKSGLAGISAAMIASLWTEVAYGGPVMPGDEARLLDVVSDLTIPATGVPGARAAQVPAFLVLAIAHNTLGAKGDEAPQLAADLNRRAGSVFLDLPPTRQHEVLEALDVACFASGVKPNSAWPIVKTLILAGYYSSEVGGSQDLRYELVPGRYDADIPYRKGDPALSNDWAGLAFL